MYLQLLLETIQQVRIHHLLLAPRKTFKLLPDIYFDSRGHPARLMPLLTSQSRMRTPQLLLGLLRTRPIGMRMVRTTVSHITHMGWQKSQHSEWEAHLSASLSNSCIRDRCLT